MATVKQGKALNIKESRILIAGAASLVGSHTADLLLKEGAREVQEPPVHRRPREGGPAGGG